MVVQLSVRERQRSASEAAIITAASGLIARRGPAGTSLRDVGAAAGCTHTLVGRYFGSKEGLVGAVAEMVGAETDRVVGEVTTTSPDPIRVLLGEARAHPTVVHLLVRSALDDLPVPALGERLHVGWLLSPAARAATTASAAVFRPTSRSNRPLATRRARLCAYAAASLVLGFVTFEGFLVAATGMAPVRPARRDLGVAEAARRLLALADQDEPRLLVRDLSDAHRLLPESTEATSLSSRDALLSSAMELFAERGPASVSVRDVARHAGVNQGLIYRHFGSKDALLAEAIDVGSSGLFPAALAETGFDFDAVSWLVHHGSPAPRLIARALVDGVHIPAVRQRFPILGQLLAAYDDLPSGPGPGGLADPRVAVALTAGLALGSSIWGPQLRPELGLEGDPGVESAIADIAHLLVMAPLAAGSPAR